MSLVWGLFWMLSILLGFSLNTVLFVYSMMSLLQYSTESIQYIYKIYMSFR